MSVRIIHTSDWHLGHELYGYKRAEEFEHFFDQLEEVVGRERPDALLVSGDIYHSSMPSASTQTMYTEAMLRLHSACPDMEIVVTAGNHDSASRLMVDRSLWQHFKVHVVGQLERVADGVDLDSHLIRIGDKAIVAAVPHVFRQNFPLTLCGPDRQRAFYHGLAKRVGEVNTSGLPTVLMAHVAVTDHLGDSVDIGGMEYFDSEILGDAYDYIALGHLHCPHSVPHGNPSVRYSGSPIAVTFNEEYEHSVTLVDIEHGQPPVLQKIPIIPLRPVHTIPEHPVTYEEALSLLSQYPADKMCYITLNVVSEGGLPHDCNERALEMAKDKQCRFCHFKVTRPIVETDDDGILLTDIDEFVNLRPTDIAQRYLESKGMKADDYLPLIDETIQKIEEEKSR